MKKPAEVAWRQILDYHQRALHHHGVVYQCLERSTNAQSYDLGQGVLEEGHEAEQDGRDDETDGVEKLSQSVGTPPVSAEQDVKELATKVEDEDQDVGNGTEQSVLR